MTLKPQHVRQLRTLGYLAAGLLGLLMIIAAVNRKGANLVADVMIQVDTLPDGSTLITREDVLRDLDLSFGYPLNSLPVREINMERVERVLEKDPFVLDAEAYMDARNRIAIRITPREPILRIIDNNRLDYYLDDLGVRMDPSPHASPHVLVATGNIPPYTFDFQEPEKEHLLADLLQLVQLIRADDFFEAMIEQVHVSNHNEVILVPKMGRQKIYFGRLRDAEDKLRRLRIFYTEAAPYEGWRRYRSLDLRFEGQVVARR